MPLAGLRGALLSPDGKLGGLTPHPRNREASSYSYSFSCTNLGLEKLRALLGSPCNEDHRILESVLEPPVFWKLPNGVHESMPSHHSSALLLTDRLAFGVANSQAVPSSHGLGEDTRAGTMYLYLYLDLVLYLHLYVYPCLYLQL